MLKRIIPFILIFVFVFTACGNEGGSSDVKESTEKSETEYSGELFKGVWLSYIELKAKGKTESEYKAQIEETFKNMKEMNTTDVFVHARAFSDALYSSSLFALSDYTVTKDGKRIDVLETALALGEKYEMNIHAWVNPYRAFTKEEAEKISDCTVKDWTEQESENVFEAGERYYLRPDSAEVRSLVVGGVREILEKYPQISGIHIDDYFYPENCGDFDKTAYEEYISSGGGLSLSDWRRENVNSLVSGIYAAVKSFGGEKLFSVSPSGDIQKDINTFYADVKLWCSTKGYCDMIIPQVYFGFDNENMPFCQTVDSWAALTENSDVKLVIGLALYKCGETDEFAGESGKNEWCENSDVLSRQAEYIKRKKLCGYSLYSASFINFSESFCAEELHNLKSVIY